MRATVNSMNNIKDVIQSTENIYTYVKEQGLKINKVDLEHLKFKVYEIYEAIKEIDEAGNEPFDDAD